MRIRGLDQLKEALDSGRHFEEKNKIGTRIFKKDDAFYCRVFSDGRPPEYSLWESFSGASFKEDFMVGYDFSNLVETGGLKLIMKKRFKSNRFLSYHFYVEEDGLGEVADLFDIPAHIDWNDDLKMRVEQSILFALIDVYTRKEMDSLIRQARELFQAIPG